MKFDKSKDFRVKPDKPHKSVLTPSSFYKGNCQRCTWMLYQHNFSVPANLALQLKMAAFQEATFDGVFSRVISQTLPEGFVRQHKGKFSSQPLDLNGKTSNWKLYGEIDLLSENLDGTYSIIDGKVSLKLDANSLSNDYWKQLEAYVYMFEKPELGEAKKISTIGLLQWRVDGALSVDNLVRGFTVEERYIPVDRNPSGFLDFISNFVSIIEGEYPEANKDCRDCQFLQQIGFYND